MDYLQALSEVRPGFRFSETVDGEGDYTTVYVAGERGDRVLIKGGETPGWYPRDDLAQFIAEASGPQSLRMRLQCRRAAASASLAH